MSKLTFLTLVFAGLSIISCRRKDIQPVVVLNGEHEQTIALGQPYVEMGAVAKDNKDGDISEDIVITGAVNKDLVGEYRLFYNVEDSEGNKAATATRFVSVVNSADFMIGTYLATPGCTGTMTTPEYNTSITTSSTVNNQVFIRKIMFAEDDQPVVANISGDVITIPSQTIGLRTISGTGNIISGNFLINVMIEGAGTSYDCSIDHIKL